jgi:hypothetical protein
MMGAGLPECLTQLMGGKLPEWIAAIAAIISMCGVLLVWKQLRLTKNIAQLQFNRQVALRKEGRIGVTTWANWVSGIRFNLSLPAFSRAWGEIKSRTEENADEFFSELRLFEESNFADPKRLTRAWAD